MTAFEQECWSRVRPRLRAAVGEAVWSTWMRSLDVVAIDTVKATLSVPNRGVQSWIDAHHMGDVLTAWQAEIPEIGEVSVILRTPLSHLIEKPSAAAPVAGCESMLTPAVLPPQIEQPAPSLSAVMMLAMSAMLTDTFRAAVDRAVAKMEEMAKTDQMERRETDIAPIKLIDIQRVVCAHFDVTRVDLLSSRRTWNVVRPRQIAMYLAKTMTTKSLPEIGRQFGKKDHTTVLHAVRKIEALVGNDNVLAEEVESLKRQLQD
jgi:chromosomal replication initiation ATPase DnaA